MGRWPQRPWGIGSFLGTAAPRPSGPSSTRSLAPASPPTSSYATSSFVTHSPWTNPTLILAILMMLLLAQHTDKQTEAWGVK